jgi:hypothetical protein
MKLDWEERTMANDFLPAVVSIGILAAAFLLVWIADIRIPRRLDVLELMQTEEYSTIELESAEPL